MDKNLIKRLLPHLAAILLMLVIVAAFYSPELTGKVLNQSDNVQALGMQSEARQYAKDGEFPLWTNGAFSGMPTYQIFGKIGTNLMATANTFFLMGQGIFSPIATTFLTMFGFYLLMISMRIDWRIALPGAIFYGFALNNMILNEAGHSTKVLAQAYLAPALAGVLLTFRGRYWLGGGMTALFLGLQIYANHLQITYYFFIFLVVLGIIKLVEASKENNLPHFAKAAGVLVLAGILAIATNLTKLWTTYEYKAETTRGVSELPAKAGKTGLTKDYAWDWSYGKLESINTLIPDFYGGSGALLMQKPGSETERAMRNAQAKFKDQSQYEQVARSTGSYWGAQPFTSGPIYYGAVVIFLFLLGAFLAKGPIKTWILIVVPLSFMIGWGENFKIINGILFDYFPMFNNFRSVSMAIGMAQLFTVILGMMGLQAFFSKEFTKDQKTAALKLGGGIALGLCLLGLGLSFILDYARPQEKDILANFPEIMTALAADRAGILRMDALRSLAFVGLAAATLWFYLKGNLNWIYGLAIVAVLGFVDLWGIGKRYVNEESFVTATEHKKRFAEPTPADLQIKQREADNPHYRVLDISRGNPFSSALTSYHHKSLGGYHAAKLMIYQELTETYLMNPIQSMHVLEMLNTRYILNYDQQQGRVVPIPTANPLGNAWFVNNFELVPNAEAELLALATLKPAEKAVIQQRFSGYLDGLKINNDSLGMANNSIKLVSYHPEKIVYESNATSEQLAVFSEIYYKPAKGWKVFIDEQPVEGFVKANYVLRALRVPAGKHKIEMRFEPTSFVVGSKVSLGASALVFLLFFGGIFMSLKASNWELAEAETLAPVKGEAAPKTKVVEKTKRRKR